MCYIQICVITRCVIKELDYIYLACLRKAPSISDIGAWEYLLPGLRCDNLLRRLCECYYFYYAHEYTA